MKTFLQFKNACFDIARTILMGALLSSGLSARGQTANPLPLSGRPAGNGSVVPTQTAIPGTTTSVNTLNPAIQVQGPYAGSANSTNKLPFSGKLTLREAIERGMAYNLGSVGMSQAVRQSYGESRAARSALLPNVNSDLTEVATQVDLAQKNREVTTENLRLTRQSYEAGITDNVEVVRSQDAVATAELDYISSVFAHNVAKLSLARSIGGTAEKLDQFLKLGSSGSQH